MNGLWIILGMALVTYIPRLLPVFILDRLVLPDWVKRWLNNIPYAALGALIFPGILTVDSTHPWIGLAGGLVAVIIACFRLHLLYGIAGSIATVMLLQGLIHP